MYQHKNDSSTKTPTFGVSSTTSGCHGGQLYKTAQIAPHTKQTINPQLIHFQFHFHFCESIKSLTIRTSKQTESFLTVPIAGMLPIRPIYERKHHDLHSSASGLLSLRQILYVNNCTSPKKRI